MDAWQILVSNSSLNNGDAWEHLNNQQEGSNVQTVPVITQIELSTAQVTTTLELAVIGLSEIEAQDAAITIDATDSMIDLDTEHSGVILEIK